MATSFFPRALILSKRAASRRRFAEESRLNKRRWRWTLVGGGGGGGGGECDEFPTTLPAGRRRYSLTSSSAASSSSSSTESHSSDAALPQNLEELKEILARDKSQVDEELWRTAVKIEYEFLRYEGASAPVVMTDETWERVFAEETTSRRRGLFKLLRLKEEFKAKKMEKRAYNRARRERRAEEYPDSASDPALFTITKKIHESRMKLHHQLYHLDYSERFGQPLVFDLGQDYRMNAEEASSFVDQMRDVYSLNRAQWEPFRLHLCNYDPEAPGQRDLVEAEERRSYSWNVAPECFTRLFPPERIVYLSPDAPEATTEWRHDDVYVVGGVVDKSGGGGGGKMTLSKINTLGIRSQRFDIDRFFKKKLAPALTLDVVFATLLDARDTDGNWLYSYRHLPKRMVRWRPEFAFMERIDHINSPYVSRVAQCHRNVFKPRMTQPPYSDYYYYARSDERDSDDEFT